MRTRRSLVVASTFLIGLSVSPYIAASKAPPKIGLTISGGVSLGVYEAGVNWVVTELLREFDHDSPSPSDQSLVAVTGASAGSVNTVISALRYCEKESEPSDFYSNSHRKSWDIDIQNLLPGPSKESAYNISLGGETFADSVFTRNAFMDSVQELEDRASEAIYKKGCRVRLGILVTRTTPRVETITVGSSERTLNLYRFVIPIEAFVHTKADAEFGVMKFRNYSRKDLTEEERLHSLFLEEEHGVIPFKEVTKAIFASSAFPLAFSRMKLEYCYDSNLPVSLSDRKICGGQYREEYLEEGYFIDGGVYDNVPLGTAVSLAEDDSDSDNFHYIFIDPHNTENKAASPLVDEGEMTLSGQLESVLPALSGLRNQVLHDTLLTRFHQNTGKNSVSRELHDTVRYSPITGNYLYNFGAFLDTNFRDYDYAVGLIDGLKYMADVVCSSKFEDETFSNYCAKDDSGQKSPSITFEGFFNRIIPVQHFEKNCANDSPAKTVCEAIALQLSDGQVRNILPWPFVRETEVSPVSAIHAVLQENPSIKFKKFLTELGKLTNTASKSAAKEEDENQFGRVISTALENRENDWLFGLLDRIVSRLHDLEDKGTAEPMLGAARRALATQHSGSLNLSDPNELVTNDIQLFIPDFIGVDGAQTGAVIAWSQPTVSHRGRAYVPLYGSLNMRFDDSLQDRSVTANLGFSYKANRFGGLLLGEVGLRGFLHFPAIDSGLHDSIANARPGAEVYTRLFQNHVELALGVTHFQRNKGNVILKLGFSDFRQTLLSFLGR